MTDTERVQTAQVQVLPTGEVDTSHHGPFIYHYWRKNTPYENGLPRFFKNPWPSYRAPSLKDAYTAYNLGAAIAHPLPYKLILSRSSLQLPHNKGKDAYRTEDGQDAPRLKNESWLPANTYVRPIFAEQFEDDEEQDWREPPVKVVQPSFASEVVDKEKVTWLGHAGVLVQAPWQRGDRDGSFGVLYDPIFSYRCSPSQYVGPARHMDSPCPVSLLPDIHVVCISHDHYYYTIMDLWKYHQRTVHFMVPLALKPWFEQSGIPSDRVTELDWWHESILTVPSTDGGRPDMAVKFVFTPAQHRSGRGVLDHMKTLWGSWCFGVIDDAAWEKREERGMQGWNGFKCYFGGDTGYRFACAPDEDDSAICPAFEEIAKHYAPFNLSLLPLNTGSSLPFLRTILSLSLDQYTLTSAQHCSPADALEIHRIVRAERSLGMHWGTFCDKDESRGTRVEFGRARRERGVSGLWEGGEGDEDGHEDGRFPSSNICNDVADRCYSEFRLCKSYRELHTIYLQSRTDWSNLRVVFNHDGTECTVLHPTVDSVTLAEDEGQLGADFRCLTAVMRAVRRILAGQEPRDMMTSSVVTSLQETIESLPISACGRVTDAVGAAPEERDRVMAFITALSAHFRAVPMCVDQPPEEYMKQGLEVSKGPYGDVPSLATWVTPEAAEAAITEHGLA